MHDVKFFGWLFLGFGIVTVAKSTTTLTGLGAVLILLGSTMVALAYINKT